MSVSIAAINDKNGYGETSTTAATSPHVPSFLSGVIPPQYLEGEYLKSFIFYSKGAGVILGAIFVCNPLFVLTTLWNLLRTIIGIALGIGLGVGLALHVYQQLQKWQVDFDKKQLQRLKLEAQSRQLKNLEEKIATSGRQSRQKASLLTKGLLSGTAGGGTSIASDANSSTNHLRHHSPLFSSASSIGHAVAVGAEDGDSYFGLMAQAGYLVHDRVLRGQVLREDHDFWKVLYRFTDDRIGYQRGVRLVADDWPALPKAVTREIGRFIEHVMRDFVSSWYSTMDRGVVFRMEQQKRDAGISRDGGGDKKRGENNDRCNAQNMNSTGAPEDRSQQRAKYVIEGDVQQENHPIITHRKMVFSTLTHRRAPMLDCCYKMMSSAFGNLASRAEHVNILELVLLKWTQVLGQTLNEYRTLRKIAQDKRAQQQHPRNSEKKNSRESISNSSSTTIASAMFQEPSEVEVTREFLLAGKLHRAITFGLDIPSLLFADASGDECGLGINSDDNNNSNPNITSTRGDPTKVLEYRLYHTDILRECQVDYNRILASRLVRALMPKSETTSQCVLGMVTEIIGGSVLTPLMNLWMPSFLNDMIVKLLTGSNVRTKEVARSSGSAHPKSNDVKNRESEKSEVEKNSNRPEPEADTTNCPEGSDRQIQTNENSETKRSKLDNSLNDKQIGGTSLDNSTNEGIQDGLVFSANKESSNSVDSKTKDNKNHNETMYYKLLKLSAMAMGDLTKHIDFERCRRVGQFDDEDTGVNWEDAECQHSILKLVMVIEAALLHGRCAYNEREEEMFPDLLVEAIHVTDTDTETFPAEDSLTTEVDNIPKKEKSITEIFMDLASDMDAFKKQLDDFLPQQDTSLSISQHAGISQIFQPDVNEVATLRTLICTWLHTGQLFRAIGLICKGADSIFAPYYASDAFLLMRDERQKFMRQIQVLDEVEIMVETMAVRVSKRLVVPEAFDLLVAPAGEVKRASHASFNDSTSHVEATPRINDSSLYYGHQSTPRYLDFQRNEAFAASLRAERKRRWRVWETRKMDEDLYTLIRKSASSRECDLHFEMHKLSRLFFNGTTIMTIRDAARKRERSEESLDEKVSLLTVEIVSKRRRIEVPDDDSSFLLRAQSRQLNPVSVHLDDRNHDMSYKCFLATYEQPAISQGSSRYGDGRYIRRCFLQYYPSDRTARIVLQNDARKLDKRKGLGPGHTNESQMNSFFSRAFLNQRYLCQKVAATQSFMSSSLMESTDFNAFPRTGKALDFIYRMSLFERPVVDLAGEQFRLQDSSNRGVHRANASSFEVSDASLSYVLLKIGKDYGITNNEEQKDGKTRGGFRKVETGRDGYPVLFLRFTKSGDQAGAELKPYRFSFVRAALMISSTRQEAQLDSLIECVKAGSAKSATKARTEERLRPVRKLLYFANDRSDHSFNQDLKLGQFLDRGQLQRNGLLNLRHPTSILQLEAKVEGTALAKEVPLASISSKSYNPDTVLYKIRCTAVVELVDNCGSANDFEPYALDDGSYSRFYREEFIVHRSMREFQTLHKQLKSQVALTESTMSTGNRIVGVAAAALSNNSLNRRNKKILIPSLAQAGKIGAMGMTKKAIIKRMELLDEYIGYLLASNSLMNRCSELLLFLSVSHPFPPEITMTKAQGNIMDLLGRTHFIRSVALNDVLGTKLKIKVPIDGAQRKKSISRRLSADKTKENGGEPVEAVEMDPNILNKVDQIPLAEVRNRILELIRLSFSFENASFVRSQMLSALETASFLAVAKQSDFRRILHDLHANHLSGEAIGGWIEKVLDTLWPDGVWMKPAPVLSPEEEHILKVKAKAKLHEGFPDQFRTLLGKEMTEEGLNMIHEMLQNKVIVKSLFYMLLDLLWIEVFPELRDTLPCASALNLDLL